MPNERRIGGAIKKTGFFPWCRANDCPGIPAKGEVWCAHCLYLIGEIENGK